MNFLQKMTENQYKELLINIKVDKGSLAAHRAQAIIMLEKKVPIDVIEAVTNYKREVIVKLRRLFIKKGYGSLVSKRKKTEPKALLKRSQKNQIIDILNTKKPSDFGFNGYEFWTTTILGHLIKEQYGVQYKSKTSLYLIFKKADFTFRKPEKQSEKRDEKRIMEWKEQYKQIIVSECERDDTVVLVGDEMVLTSQTRLQRVWLPLNQPAFVQDTSKRQTTHIYGFLNIQSGVETVFQSVGQTGEITVSILKKLSLQYSGKRIVIFWDNASWHKSETVREYLRITNCFQLYNFPPYAPDLNPQEHVWKEIREKITNNRLINNINAITRELLEFANNSIFKYKFFGVHGTWEL
jgi:transposase